MRSRAVLEVLVYVVPKGLLKTALLFRHWFGVLGYRSIADEVRAGRRGVCVRLRQSDSDVDDGAGGRYEGSSESPEESHSSQPRAGRGLSLARLLGLFTLGTLEVVDVHHHLPVPGLRRSAGNGNP